MPPEDEINFNRLIQIYQQEKKGGLPVKLAPDFYERLRDYLGKLKASYDGELAKDPSSIKSLQLADQLQKVRNLHADILNLRWRKLLLLAHQSHGGGSSDTKVFTPEEMELYESILATLCLSRERFLGGVAPKTVPETTSSRDAVILAQPAARPSDGAGPLSPPPKKTPECAPTSAIPSGDPDMLVVVRILDDVPDFALGEKGSYSLRKKDIVALPRSLATILESHRKARPVA